MTTVDIEKLNQLISRTDMSGNDKVKWLVDFIDGREAKQETLEEAALNKYNYGLFINEQKRPAFIEGAKWQQQNSYSEEEVINALHSVELKHNRDFTKIYEGVLEYLKELKNK